MILDISQENKYTETEKEVIDYLMNHLDLLVELSINDLAKKNNLKPIFGLDLNIESYNFSFIILNETGYRNLCALFARIQSEKIPLEDAKTYFSGCFVIFDSKNNIFDIVNDETRKTLAKIAKGIEKFAIGLDVTRLDKMNMIRQFANDYTYDLIAFPHIKYLKKNDAIVIKMLEAIENKEKLDFKTCEGEQYLRSESEYLAIYKEEEITLIHSLIKEIDFDFVGNSYPALLAGRVQPY